VPFGGYKI